MFFTIDHHIKIENPTEDDLAKLYDKHPKSYFEVFSSNEKDPEQKYGLGAAQGWLNKTAVLNHMFFIRELALKREKLTF